METTMKTTMKITTIAQIQEIINQPLEVIANGVYNVPGWPTVAMNRASLLKWANAIGAASLAVNLLEATTLIATAKAQYRRRAQTRSQKQAARLAAMLVA
jgi:hypothetical protein